MAVRGRPPQCNLAISYQCDRDIVRIVDDRVDPLFRAHVRWATDPGVFKNMLRSAYMQGFVDGKDGE